MFANDDSIPKDELITTYNKGDVLVFRADFVHGGAGFHKDNLRIHIYYDRKNIYRNRGSTQKIVVPPPRFRKIITRSTTTTKGDSGKRKSKSKRSVWGC